MGATGRAGREIFRRGDDAAAVAVDRGVEVETARNHVSLPPAGAIADHADAPIRRRERVEEVGRAAHVADALLVGNATRFARPRAASAARAPGAYRWNRLGHSAA